MSPANLKVFVVVQRAPYLAAVSPPSGLLLLLLPLFQLLTNSYSGRGGWGRPSLFRAANRYIAGRHYLQQQAALE